MKRSRHLASLSEEMKSLETGGEKHIKGQHSRLVESDSHQRRFLSLKWIHSGIGQYQEEHQCDSAEEDSLTRSRGVLRKDHLEYQIISPVPLCI